jgi:hypothetical protein
MSIENNKQGIEDIEEENALRHFRQSVRSWSENEFAQPRVVAARRSAFSRTVMSPVAGWALACAVLAGGVGVPLQIHHRHQLALQQQALIEQQRKAAEEAAKLSAASAMNDDELLNHLDSDIAQTTPDAMQPLASLMNEKSQ